MAIWQTLQIANFLSFFILATKLVSRLTTIFKPEMFFALLLYYEKKI